MNRKIYYPISMVYQVTLFLTNILIYHYSKQNQYIYNIFINVQYPTINQNFLSQITLSIIKVFQEKSNILIIAWLHNPSQDQKS